MPKKFSTENPKATAARDRKKSAKEALESKKQQQADDAFWEDDNKQAKKKQQRKDDQDKKREQQLAKKAENKLLLEEEMSNLKGGKPAAPSKVTRAQINTTLVKKEPEKKPTTVTHLDEPLEENLNRMKIDGEEARSVTEAISVLSSQADDLDKHPEKRMKAAFTAFETRRLEELKTENPSLRLSQLKQMIFKEWQKSPENPLNKQ